MSESFAEDEGKEQESELLDESFSQIPESAPNENYSLPTPPNKQRKAKSEDKVEAALIKHLEGAQSFNSAEMLFARGLGVSLEKMVPAIRRQAKLKILQVVCDFEEKNDEYLADTNL